MKPSKLSNRTIVKRMKSPKTRAFLSDYVVGRVGLYRGTTISPKKKITELWLNMYPRTITVQQILIASTGCRGMPYTRIKNAFMHLLYNDKKTDFLESGKKLLTGEAVAHDLISAIENADLGNRKIHYFKEPEETFKNENKTIVDDATSFSFILRNNSYIHQKIPSKFAKSSKQDKEAIFF